MYRLVWFVIKEELVQLDQLKYDVEESLDEVHKKESFSERWYIPNATSPG